MQVRWFINTSSLSLGACLISCSLLTSPHVISPSPDGLSRVIILRLEHPPDESARIDLETENKRFTIYSDTEDRWLGQVEVFWSKDSKIVECFICDSMSAPVRVRYDRVSNQQVSWIGDQNVKTQVIQRYRPTTSQLERFTGDVLEWFCSVEGRHRYREVTRSDDGITKLRPIAQ